MIIRKYEPVDELRESLNDELGAYLGLRAQLRPESLQGIEPQNLLVRGPLKGISYLAKYVDGELVWNSLCQERIYFLYEERDGEEIAVGFAELTWEGFFRYLGSAPGSRGDRYVAAVTEALLDYEARPVPPGVDEGTVYDAILVRFPEIQEEGLLVKPSTVQVSPLANLTSESLADAFVLPLGGHYSRTRTAADGELAKVSATLGISSEVPTGPEYLQMLARRAEWLRPSE